MNLMNKVSAKDTTVSTIDPKISAREAALRKQRGGRRRPSMEEIAKDTSVRFAETIKRLGE